jgi:hypothetical protein
MFKKSTEGPILLSVVVSRSRVFQGEHAHVVQPSSVCWLQLVDPQ